MIILNQFALTAVATCAFAEVGQPRPEHPQAAVMELHRRPVGASAAGRRGARPRPQHRERAELERRLVQHWQPGHALPKRPGAARAAAATTPASRAAHLPPTCTQRLENNQKIILF